MVARTCEVNMSDSDNIKAITHVKDTERKLRREFQELLRVCGYERNRFRAALTKIFLGQGIEPKDMKHIAFLALRGGE